MRKRFHPFNFRRECLHALRIAAAVVIVAGCTTPISAQSLPILVADFGLPWMDGGGDVWPGPLRVNASSSAVNNAGVYTITETVRFSTNSNFVGIQNAYGSFRWFSVNRDDPGAAFPFPKIWSDAFAYNLGTHYPASATWQSLAPVIAAPGIIFVYAEWEIGIQYVTPGYVAANAATWAMAPQVATGLGSGSLSASFGEGNIGIQLDSDVTAISGSGGYRYDYTLTNTTGETATVDWEAAAIHAVLAPGESFNHTIVSDRLGQQANGYATLNSQSFADVKFIANAIVPVPEPASFLSLALGIALVGAQRPPRRREQSDRPTESR